ncbi:MAG: O-antigen ligase family protein [Acidobacteriota bacterium]|nr:O-antigen ligase family protein [Acidobacteriota bacterium]
MKITTDQIISVVFVMLVVFTALAHGVVEPWSELIFVLSVAALVLLWAIKVFREKKLSLFIPANLWPLIGLILLGVVQGNRVFSFAGLSLDVEATQATTLLLCCLLVTSLVAANFMTHRERLQTLMQFLTIFGLVLATFSMIQHFTSSDKFYWMRVIESKTSFGPFVNRNHFAGYLELLLPWPVALMLTRRRSLAEKSFYLFIAAWMVVVAVFSLSRGGMISIFAQLVFMATFRPRQFDETERVASSSGVMRFARQAALAAVFLLTIFGGLNWLGAERVIDRVTAGFETNQAAAAQPDSRQLFTGHRNELWRDSWKIFTANPLIGAGLGAYETALPAHNQNRNLGMIASQAHNDYLQTLTDAGLIGALLAVWFLVVTARAVVNALRVHEPLMSNAAFGCGAALFGLSVHSLFDFNLQLLSHSLLFLAFAAIVSQLSELATLITANRVRTTGAIRQA